MNQLYNDDCFEYMKKISNKIKFDAIITDPPYGINYNKNEWDKKNNINWKFLFLQLNNILKKNGNMIFFAGWSNVCNVIKEVQNSNFILKKWIAWDRQKCGNPGNNLTSTKEEILWFIKKENNNIRFNKMDSKISKKTKGYGVKNGSEFRRLSNVWSDISGISYMSKEYQGNDCQKPVELMERCINLWTNENDFVFDCFMGSGATGMACQNLNRNFIGIEKDKKVFNKAKKRLKNEN